MKHCPNCQTRYTDDTLRFCLQDGMPLVADSEVSQPTVAFGEAETETVISPRKVERLPIDVPENYATNRLQNSEIVYAPTEAAAPPRKSRTLPIVLATAFVTLLLLGAGGIGAWLYLRNNQNEVAKNSAVNQTANTNSNSKPNAKNSPSPTATPKNQENANAANAAASPTPVAVNVAQVKKDVSGRINSWIDLTESRDIDEYMNLYAGTVDYYSKSSVSAATIRNDKQRAFDSFDSIQINISNLNITPDATGERATAVFDKEWVFEGEEKYSAGKVQSQLQLKKINNQWLIVGERDLKVYYTE